MSDIFLSYERTDKDHARQLAEALKARGWSVWWDRKIPPGKTFEEVISEAITSAHCMVVLWSATSIKSDWVRDEAQEGRTKGILVPVSFDGQLPPMGFRQLQAADLSQWSGDAQHEGFTSLCDEIERRLHTLEHLPSSGAESEPERALVSTPFPEAEPDIVSEQNNLTDSFVPQNKREKPKSVLNRSIIGIGIGIGAATIVAIFLFGLEKDKKEIDPAETRQSKTQGTEVIVPASPTLDTSERSSEKQEGSHQSTRPSTEGTASVTTTLATSEERLSYGIAYGLGQRMVADDVPIDVDAFYLGLGDALAGEQPRLTQEEIAAEMQAYQEKGGAEKQSTRPSTEGTASVTTTLATSEERLSYGIAYGLGQRMVADDVPIDVDAFYLGLSDGLAGEQPRITQEEITAEMQAYQEKWAAEKPVAQAVPGEANQAAAAAFLAANATKESVNVTESGLQYEILEEGDGPRPGPDDTVEVHYRGTLVDGTEFDSSYARGQTVTFGVGQVIPGWTEALQLMRVGSKWKLAIPPELAYGAHGAGKVIGPNAALLFDVELIAITSH